MNEKLQSWIDNINLMYVAFTRAKNELIINAPVKKPKKNGSINSVGDILYGLFYKGQKPEEYSQGEAKKIIDLTEGFDVERAVFEFGNSTVLNEDRSQNLENGKTEIVFDNYPVNSSQRKLRLKLGCDSYFHSGENKISRNITLGKMKHEMFEYIKTKEDIGKAVRRMVFDGKLNEGEAKVLKNQILDAMKNPIISSWFEPGWRVKTESSILIPGGTEYRPDRVQIKDNVAVVIDYKFTVRQAESHKNQVKNYMKFLKEMEFNEVEGYLWYVEKNSIEELVL